MKITQRLLFSGVALLYSALAFSSDILVNKPDSIKDSRYEYPHQLLQKILDVTSTEYGHSNVKHAKSVMSRDRLLISMLDGQQVHVVAEAPKPDWIKQLLVIRIPVRKGIQGYRLFFIHKKDRFAIAQVESLKDLQQFKTGSGEGWSTASAMANAGFEVVTGSSYNGLFHMLERGRFATLGRGINEIYAELEAQQAEHPSLTIDKTLALHIPLPTYFFVTPKMPELARRIEIGLQQLIQNGEFEKLFFFHHEEVIEKSKLKSRKVFHINNTNLTAQDPLGQENLWYRF